MLQRVVAFWSACVLAASLATQGCQPAGLLTTGLTPQAGQPPETIAKLVLDVPAVTSAVVEKPNVTWQDASFSGEPFRSARQALAKANPKYRTQAVGVTWSRLEPGAISSTPAFARTDNQFDSRTTPDANDLLFAILDNGTLQKINPGTNVVIQSQMLSPVSRTGLVLSGDNRCVYVLTTNGWCYVVNTSNLTTIWAQKISQTGFAGRSPFVDFSNASTGQDDNIYAMSQDGSLYRVRVQRNPFTGAYTVTCHAYPKTGGTDVGSPQASWSTTAAFSYGAAMTPGTSPVVWGGQAWVGDNAGTFYRLVTNPSSPATAPTVTAWNLTGYTSATGAGRACSAPASFDFDEVTLNVTRVFVPFGDRVAWIAPAQATPVAVSPPLVVDKKPGAANYNGLLSNFPYTTATLPYTAMDWACVAELNNPTPTRWGSGSAVSGSFSTGISCATIKRSPLTGNMWCGQYTSPLGAVQALTSAGVVVGTYPSNTANCNEICFDSAGNCYAAHGSSPNITKFNPAGTVVQTFAYPTGNALWPETDASGNVWATGFSGRLVKFSPAGAVLVNVAVANSFSLAINQTTGDVYVCRDASPGQILKYNNAGTLQWTTNVGNGPKYVAIEPGTGNIWTANYNSNTVSKVSPLGVVLGTYATAANPWAIAFDGGGLPWVSCLGPDSVTKMSLTGATIATYTMPGSGNPYEIAFDGNGDCWVSCANGTYKLYDLGNLGDLFASNHFGVIGDGDDSYSFLKFRVTANAYARRVPVGARVSMTAATTSITGAEDYAMYESSAYLPPPAGGTPWQGWGRTINTNWSTRPVISGAATSTQTGVNPVKDVTTTNLPFTVNYPVDQTNTTDGAGGVYSYAVNCTSNKVLKNLAHWYSNSTAPGAPQQPTLTMTVANGTLLPNTNGIQCQATFGLRPNSLLISAANTVFELDINPASPRDFADSSKVVYSLTAAGRAGGPVSGGQYLYPRTNVSVNYWGDIFVMDQDVASGKIYANRFNNDFNSAPTANHLAQSLDCAPGAGTLGQCMIFDYDRGSLYLTTSNNYLLRLSLF